MSAPLPIRVIEMVRITEYAPAPGSSPVQVPELPRGYDPELDSPLAGLGSMRYVGEPVEPKRRRRWFR